MIAALMGHWQLENIANYPCNLHNGHPILETIQFPSANYIGFMGNYYDMVNFLSWLVSCQDSEARHSGHYVDGDRRHNIAGNQVKERQEMKPM